MKYIDNNNFKMHDTCVAFGDFDGVHRGHRAVIDRLLKVSGQGLTSVIISFEYDEPLLEDKTILSTAEEKRYLINDNGPEVLISHRIDSNNRDVPVKRFLKEIVVDKLGAKAVVAGSSSANIDILRECADEYGYTLYECNDVSHDGERVTAERIKHELAQGRLKAANELLGHPYLLIGEVMHGKEIGRTVGMPTANLGYKKYKQLPAHGVYGTLSEIDGRYLGGLTNIGRRPSVDDYNYVTIETYLLDFSGDLYGKTITLEIHVFIRGVVKFNNINEVKAQVNKDIDSVRAYLDTVRLLA